MPIYEFTCQQCNLEFEELVPKMDATAPCPSCGSGEVARRVSQFAFKGGSKSSAANGGSCSSCSSGAGSCSTCRR